MANDVTIDELQIKIEAESGTAASNLDDLAKSLDRLQTVTQRMTGGGDGLNKVAKQIEKLNAISQKIQSMRGFERLGKVVNQLSKLDRLSNVGDISGLVRNLNKLPQAVNAIAQMPSIDATKFQQIADALKPLNDLGTNNINSFLRTLGKFSQTAQQLAGVDLTQFEQQIRRISTSLEPLTRQAERGGAGLTALAHIMQSTSRQARQSSDGVSLFNQTLGQIKVKTLAAIAGLRRLFSVLKSSVTTSNDYVENLNLFTVTMGGAADEALRFANTVNDLMGIDVSQWIQNQGVFKQMASGFGMVDEKANLLSKNLTQIGYDIASYYNISTESAMQKLQSGLAGEIMPLRSLGYALDEATIKQVALNHGITESVTNMSQAQKAQLRYIAIMEQSTNAMGDMARTIDSPANQIRILEARIQTLKRAIGDSLMPVVSAALPYITAFVQILGEAFRGLAEFMGFELPEFDYSDVMTKQNENIANSFDDATEASNKFKGTLAGIDQLNIIGSKKEDSGTGNENQFDLGIELPEYDFLQGLKKETDKAYDTMKRLLPVIGAIATGLLGFKISKSPLFTQLTELAQKATPLGKVAHNVKGIVGGLLAGSASGLLIHGGIKNLISGEGELGLNIAETVAGGLVGGVAIAKFTKAGNKWGAALTAGFAAYGITSGILSGISKNIQKANQEIMDSAIYNNGGAKITEIADAFEEWAAAGKRVNDEFIGKYAALDEYDAKISEVKSTIEEITGIDLKLDEITPADAEKLKEPFNQLANYLKTEFKEQVTLAAQSVEDAIKNLDLGGTLSAEMQGAFKSMQRQMDESYSQVQSSVDEYLDRISQGKKLSNTEMTDFTEKYNYMFEVDNQEDEGLQNLKRTLSDIDMSKIDLENDKYALESIERIKTASTEYVQSAKDRLQAELDNTAELRRKTQLAFDHRNVTGMTLDQYNQQMDLLNLSDNLLGMNFQKQIQDVRGEVERFTSGINSTLAAGAESTKADWYEWLAAFFTNDLDNLDSIAKGSALRKSDAYNAMQDLDLTAFDWKTDIEINNVFATESIAQQWAIIQGEKNPNLELEIGRIQDATGNLKYIVGTEQALIDAQVEAIKSKTEGWKILTGEKTAQIKAELVNSPFTAEYKAFLSKDSLTPTHTDMGEVYKKIQQTNASLGGSSYRLPAFAGTIGGTIGAAREAVSGAAQGAVQGSAIAAEFVIHNYNDINVDGETLAECVSESQQRQMVYSNGR